MLLRLINLCIPDFVKTFGKKQCKNAPFIWSKQLVPTTFFAGVLLLLNCFFTSLIPVNVKSIISPEIVSIIQLCLGSIGILTWIYFQARYDSRKDFGIQHRFYEFKLVLSFFYVIILFSSTFVLPKIIYSSRIIQYYESKFEHSSFHQSRGSLLYGFYDIYNKYQIENGHYDIRENRESSNNQPTAIINDTLLLAGVYKHPQNPNLLIKKWDYRNDNKKVILINNNLTVKHDYDGYYVEALLIGLSHETLSQEYPDRYWNDGDYGDILSVDGLDYLAELFDKETFNLKKHITYKEDIRFYFKGGYLGNTSINDSIQAKEFLYVNTTTSGQNSERAFTNIDGKILSQFDPTHPEVIAFHSFLKEFFNRTFENPVMFYTYLDQEYRYGGNEEANKFLKNLLVIENEVNKHHSIENDYEVEAIITLTFIGMIYFILCISSLYTLFNIKTIGFGITIFIVLFSAVLFTTELLIGIDEEQFYFFATTFSIIVLISNIRLRKSKYRTIKKLIIWQFNTYLMPFIYFTLLIFINDELGHNADEDLLITSLVLGTILCLYYLPRQLQLLYKLYYIPKK